MKIKNSKVVIYSIIAIICIILAIALKQWLLIIVAVILMMLNQRELFSKHKDK